MQKIRDVTWRAIKWYFVASAAIFVFWLALSIIWISPSDSQAYWLNLVFYFSSILIAIRLAVSFSTLFDKKPTSKLLRKATTYAAASGAVIFQLCFLYAANSGVPDQVFNVSRVPNLGFYMLLIGLFLVVTYENKPKEQSPKL